MAVDPMAVVRAQIGVRIDEIRARSERLSPLDLHARMEAIRQIAADHGLTAMEGLARCSAQMALLPGHRIALRSCLEHVDEAIESRSSGDCSTILAARAARLN